jgi:HK97 family phage portal protein
MTERRSIGMRAPVSDRSLGPPDPLNSPPRSEVTPNTNDPVGSVGPNVPVAGDLSAQEAAAAGFGATHVMYDAAFPPPQAQAWAGWPVEWAVPTDRAVLAGLVTSDIVWVCVDKNATAVASMPVAATDGAGNPLAAQPSWLVNPQPEVYSHWAEFMRQIWWSYQLTGEVFVAATSRFADSGYPRTFCMINPWMVSVDMVDGVRRYSIGGDDVSPDLLHIRYASWPGDGRGHGPLEGARDRLLAVKVLMRYGADLAANGGIPWAVLKHKFKLTGGQAQALKAQWIEAARSRMGAPAILDQDMDLTALNVTPRDMALSELQQFAEARIAVLLGMQPFLVALPNGGNSLTYSTTQSMYDAHWRETLQPHSRYLMGALSAWALPGRTSVEVDAEAYIRPDPLARANAYKILVEIGAMTADEVRRAERLPARVEAVA